MEPIAISNASGEPVATITPAGDDLVLVTSQQLLDRTAVLALTKELAAIASRLGV